MYAQVADCEAFAVKFANWALLPSNVIVNVPVVEFPIKFIAVTSLSVISSTVSLIVIFTASAPPSANMVAKFVAIAASFIIFPWVSDTPPVNVTFPLVFPETVDPSSTFTESVISIFTSLSLPTTVSKSA